MPHNNDNKNNDGDLFCSDLKFLNGLKNTRIYDPRKDTFVNSGDMNYARWYPAMVTQPDGTVLTFSGVTKLIKPVYPARPADSAANERHVERYDPRAGTWTVLPDSAKKSLPLYPRMHLLPDGHTLYDGAGQTNNPGGGAWDETTWNMVSVFDPRTNTWSDKGLADFGGAPLGFRGSGFSIMLTLKPNDPVVRFLDAGGVYGVTPGTYLGTNTSTINEIDTAHGDALTSHATGHLHSGRWYGTGVMLPTGEVLIADGADRDHTVSPGAEFATKTTEIYNPATGEWKLTASQERGRTYHSTAMLLPDGRVLLGGHAPIGTARSVPAVRPVDVRPWGDPLGGPPGVRRR